MSLKHLLRHETQKIFQTNGMFSDIITQDRSDAKPAEDNWFEFVNQVANGVLSHCANQLLDQLAGANVFDIFHHVGATGGLYTMLAPYFIAFSLFSKDKQFTHDLLEQFQIKATKPKPSAGHIEVAHFTDTFYEVNGVAMTLKRQVEMALKNQKRYSIITSNVDYPGYQPGIVNFKPIGVYELPEYPEQKLFIPPFLEMLKFCYEKNVQYIHSATPGPIGLAALAISHFLRIPISGTYHTSLPQYAQYLTNDEMMVDLTWKYTIWYYDQMDYIYVPSKSTGEELIEKGLDENKIKLFPRGMDIQLFHPMKQNGILKQIYNISNKYNLLYVGRVSKEKNLPILANAFKMLIESNLDVHLIVVGDGPYLQEMKESLAGLPCTFTGYLSGEKLANVYASSDLFVFPSTTDTFGNVVLEAQASGIPVIVTDQGGPQENMVLGKTGLIISGQDEIALKEAIIKILTSPVLLKQMKKQARHYMENRSFESAFIQTWEMYSGHVEHTKAAV